MITNEIIEDEIDLYPFNYSLGHSLGKVSDVFLQKEVLSSERGEKLAGLESLRQQVIIDHHHNLDHHHGLDRHHD